MIDILAENVIPLSAVPDHLPEQRARLSTVRAWVIRGCRGNVLETVVVG